jgi:hypothetical protein
LYVELFRFFTPDTLICWSRGSRLLKLTSLRYFLTTAKFHDFETREKQLQENYVELLATFHILKANASLKIFAPAQVCNKQEHLAVYICNKQEHLAVHI